MSRQTKQFQEAYKRLNSEQRLAVDTVEGPVIVIAGPGTGKTTILTLRIANILRVTDASADSILALTFTESAAQEMRQRLVEMIGSAAYRVSISTFHGFCNEQIQRYPEHFPEIIGASPLSDIERIQLIERLIQEEELDVLRPIGSPLFYVRAVLGAIAELKKEGISIEEFQERIITERDQFEKNNDKFHTTGAHTGKMKGVFQDQERYIKKNEELCILYRRYQQMLQESRRYDFDDMIIGVIEALETNNNFKLTLQEQYQYLLADEHQDANGAQNRLLELLSDYHASPNLFIVGDDKQAIFRFQGASLENFLYFKNKYPQSTEIVLQTNYRSEQGILDAASSLINHGDVASQIALTSTKIGKNNVVDVFECATEDVENTVIVNEIEKHISKGIDISEIAILVRDNSDAFHVIDALKQAKLPFVLESKQDVLSDDQIQKLLSIFRAIHTYGHDDHWATAALIGFLDIDPLDVYTISSQARKRNSSVYTLMRNHNQLDLINASAVDSFQNNLARWKTISSESIMVDLFDSVVEESGYLTYILSKDNATSHLARLQGLFDEIRRLAASHPRFTLEEFMEYLRVLSDHGIVIKKNVGSLGREGVRILTAHSAKGREFDVVFIVGAVDGHWGNRRNRTLFRLPLQDGAFEGNDINDERRLFFVSLTRARLKAAITWSRIGLNGRNNVPTQFLTEMNDDFLTRGDTRASEEAVALWHRTAPGPVKSTDNKWVTALFLQQGISVTALNNYLECPWKYFFMNLVRVPRAPAPHQLYGIAVHAALRSFFDGLREGKEPGSDDLIKRFKESLTLEWMDRSTFKEWEKRGAEHLSGYYKHYRGTWDRNVINEFFVGGVAFSPNITLKGQLDKLELIDGSNNVNVIDYKTGKPKSRNVIEGKTKNSDGTIKRQLTFYKLLLDHDDSPYNFVSAEIDFVEPNAAGRYKKERFEIVNDDVKDLSVNIEKMGQDLMALSFWNDRCKERSCEYCRLREMMA